MADRVVSRPEEARQSTIAASKESVTRDLLRALQQFVEVTVKERQEASDWVSQDDSPLGRRAHIRAVRRGDLPGHKVGRKFLVRRPDVDRFLAGHRVGPVANDTNEGALAAALNALDLAKAG